MMTAIRKALECSIVAVASVAAFLLAGCEPAALDGPVAGKGAVIVSLASPAAKGQSDPDYFLPSETRLDAIDLLVYQNGEKVYGERYASTNGGTLTVTLDPKSFDTYAALKAQAITCRTRLVADLYTGSDWETYRYYPITIDNPQAGWTYDVRMTFTERGSNDPNDKLQRFDSYRY